MRLKNIQFSSPVAVFPHFASVGTPQSSLAVRHLRMLGQGMVLYSATAGQIPLIKLVAHIRNPQRSGSALYRVARGQEMGTGQWKDFLNTCLSSGTKEIAPFGVIADFSIPRPNEVYADYIQEVQACAEVFQDTHVPLLVQVSITTPPDVVRQIAETVGVDGIVLSEYLPWNTLPKEVRTIFFNRTESPYIKEGGGLAVGKYWTPIALEWITQIRRAGVFLPILGGGFLRGSDVDRCLTSGFSAVYIGRSVRALRPWQKYSIARRARKHNS